MKVLACLAGALLALSAAAHATPEQDLARVLRRASGSSNPSVSFLEGIGALGDVDLNAAQIRAAVASAPIHPALRPIVDRMQGLQIRGGRVSFSFREAFALNLNNRAYAHFGRTAGFQLSGRSLTQFRGFKLSQTPKGLKVAPSEIRFGEHAGVPSAWITVPLLGTHRVPLVEQSAGLSERVRIG
ncbi:MAG: hypothetical protein R3F62_30920 [Planctomycetota bacterium]